MADMFNQEGWVKRVDVLLRARYPLLTTKIFNLDDKHHQIYLVGVNDKLLQEIEPIFDKEIRFVTLAVTLTNTIPKIYKAELVNIKDDELGTFEGLFMTHNDLVDAIEGKFAVIITKYTESPVFKLYVNSNDKHIVKKIQGFVNSIKLPRRLEVGTFENNSKYLLVKGKDDNYQDVRRIISSRRRLEKMPFLRRDEELWFDNISNIFNGALTKNDLFFYDDQATSCYLDFTSFDNINLRNHVMLYDKIYITPPLNEKMDAFWRKQKIQENEFLNVIEKGQIKLLLNQPEERLDQKFLMKVYERNKSAIVSRRAVSALLAVDIVDIFNNYLFAQEEHRKIVLENINDISRLTNIPLQFLENMLFWPIQAMRLSMEALHKAGHFKPPIFSTV